MSNPSQGEIPMFESLHEALRTLVTKLGGTKKVAPKLWPEKPVLDAQSLLSDCLNPARREKLSPEQLVLIMRWGQEAGHHVAMAFICMQAGYEMPKVLNPKDEAEKLADRIESAGHDLRALLVQVERLSTSGVLRTLPSKSASG